MPETTEMLPIFKLYSIEQLAERLHRSEAYLIGIKAGHYPARPQFRSLCAGILNRPLDELFGAEAGE